MISNFKNFRGQGRFGDKKPAPSLAYEVVYGKLPPNNRGGRYPGQAETKKWKGIEVDKHLKDKWLRDLNNIKNVEIRSSCEGHAEDWITYVVFRLEPYLESKENVEKVAQTLTNYDNVYSGYDIGQQNRPRIVCAAPLWYNGPDQDKWEKWWDGIAKKIESAVKQLN
jgi:hypothetical protein